MEFELTNQVGLSFVTALKSPDFINLKDTIANITGKRPRDLGTISSSLEEMGFEVYVFLRGKSRKGYIQKRYFISTGTVGELRQLVSENPEIQQTWQTIPRTTPEILERRTKVAFLRDQDQSLTRKEIARALEISKGQINRDIAYLLAHDAITRKILGRPRRENGS